MQTTLNKIREKSPCKSGWEKLLRSIGKTKAEDEPVSIVQILNSNGLDDALWCLRAVNGYDKEIRLYAVWCARQVEHLMNDERSKQALVIAELFANGEASQKDLAAAEDAAGYAARDAAEDAEVYAARDAAWAAAGDAAGYAAWVSAWAAAGAAARSSQEKRLRELCAQIEAREQVQS